MLLSQSRLICRECGDMLLPDDVINHAYNTGHRHFTYKGDTAKTPDPEGLIHD